MVVEIPQLQEIAGKTWKKEYELKGLKIELATLDRKIQLELAPPVEKEGKEEKKATDNAEAISNVKDNEKNHSFTKARL